MFNIQGNWGRPLNEYIKMPDGQNSHFTYKELVFSHEAIRKDIYNVPNERQWLNLEALVQNILEPVRLNFGPIRVTSGYRSAELCEAIGSSKASNHARGEAADFEPASRHVTLVEVLAWIYENLEFRELIAEFFPMGWIHVAFRAGQNQKILKLKDARHDYTPVTLDYVKSLYM